MMQRIQPLSSTRFGLHVNNLADKTPHTITQLQNTLTTLLPGDDYTLNIIDQGNGGRRMPHTYQLQLKQGIRTIVDEKLTEGRVNNFNMIVGQILGPVISHLYPII